MSHKPTLDNGMYCLVVAGTHKGKGGLIEDKHMSKTGAITITVKQNNGVRFKTLLKNVEQDPAR